MSESNQNIYKDLITAAEQAAKHAYAPYSHKSRGAALLSADGKVYTACNIEFANYSGSICAEEAALSKAVSEGVRKFKAIAVTPDLPCGGCRQFLSEFGNELEIVTKISEKIETVSLKQLLPARFGKTNLES